MSFEIRCTGSCKCGVLLRGYPTLNAAASDFTPGAGEEIVEVTYALRWNRGDGETLGYRAKGKSLFIDRKDADRFQTAAEARASVSPLTLAGAGDDPSGWKVVRLTRKRKP